MEKNISQEENVLTTGAGGKGHSQSSDRASQGLICPVLASWVPY